MTDYTGQRVVVMGLGRFGGGVGVTQYLAKHGAQVLVTDQASAASLAESVSRLEGLANVRLRLAEHREVDFAQADLVVANPAVKPTANPYLEAARRAGASITSEIRLLVNQLPNRRRVIGVTGSAGKSTVTAMLGQSLSDQTTEQAHANASATKPQPTAAFAPASASAACARSTPRPLRPCAPPPHRTWIGGNLGGSLLNHLGQIDHDDWVVLELSSFMLHSLAADHWSPGVGVITNLSPNHIDWHGSFEHYAQAKRRILEFQDRADIAVLGPGVSEQLKPAAAKTLAVEQPDAALGELTIPGTHNRLNATLTLRTLDTLGVERLDVNREQVLTSLREFEGLPHRLRFVAEHDGVRFYDDSKSTTPDAAKRALHVFEAGRVHAILGGYDKGSDLSPLASLAAEHCRAIYTIGQIGPTIAEAAENLGARVLRCGDLDQALSQAVQHARPGDIVLLSPGCASWDQFDHFQQRGQRFIELVQALPRSRISPHAGAE